ncbi:MAG: hypothetical protein Ct9H300mP25_14970 [Acidobacteriota bacterium]|nr:MAG: hypothetical protein Ct9H300mP25_14970 [Acidobacteriota bacterium]
MPERARRIGSKLRQTPRLIDSARENVSEAPGLFVKVAIESFEGVLSFIEKDLPRAFREPRRPPYIGRFGRCLDGAATSLRGFHWVFTRHLGTEEPRDISYWAGSI